MRIRCNVCGKSVSTEISDDTIIRAWIECPECLTDRSKNDEEYEGMLIKSIEEATKRRVEDERN